MFLLTKKPRLYGLECTQPDGTTFDLTFREMTDDEKEQYDHDMAEARNVPGDTPKQRTERVSQVRVKYSGLILVGWDRVVDEEKNTVPLTEDNKGAFYADPESRKFWLPYLMAYLFPSTKGTEGKQGPDPQS